MSSQSLIPHPNGGPVIAALSAEDRTLFGLDTLTREDQILPRVRLAQNTSQTLGEAAPGQFHNNLTGDCSAEVLFVPLRVQKGRVMWPGAYEAKQDPLCASDDSRKPREEYGDQYDGGAGCAKCPMAAWGENHEAPRCSLTYNYLSVDILSGLPFMAGLNRTSAKAAKQLNTLFQAYTVTHAIRATSEKVKSDQGVWYEWRIADAGKVEGPERFVQMARSLAGRVLTTDTGDEGAADGEGPAPDFDGEHEPLPF
jgi:hypothetical protein